MCSVNQASLGAFVTSVMQNTIPSPELTQAQDVYILLCTRHFAPIPSNQAMLVRLKGGLCVLITDRLTCCSRLFSWFVITVGTSLPGTSRVAVLRMLLLPVSFVTSVATGAVNLKIWCITITPPVSPETKARPIGRKSIPWAQ